MKEGDIINWPSDVKLGEIYRMTSKDIKKLHKLAKEDKLEFSPEFISRFTLMNDSVKKLRSYVTQYLGVKLAQKLNLPSVNKIPWSQMKEGDIINWPSDVKYGRMSGKNQMELHKLDKLAKEDLLDFSPEFISRFKLMNGLKNDSLNKLRSEVAKHLGDKLAKKLNVPSIKVPWSKMKEGDIINWPSDVKFGGISRMNQQELQKLHKLAKDDLLEFSPEFLRLIELDLAECKLFFI
jgi:hypothetical protein